MANLSHGYQRETVFLYSLQNSHHKGAIKVAKYVFTVLLCAISLSATASNANRALLLELPSFLRHSNPQITTTARKVFADSYKEIFSFHEASPEDFTTKLTAPGTDQIFCTETHNSSAYHIQCKFIRTSPSKRELTSDSLGCLNTQQDNAKMEAGLIQALHQLAASMKENNRITDAEYLYKRTCFVCHDTGATGAPRIGDKAAWEPRIRKGIAALKKSTFDGLAAMPPRGTCGECSDKELEEVVHYMIEKSR